MVLFSVAEDEAYLATLKNILKDAKNDHQLFESIVNAPFSDRRHSTLMGLGIVVLLMVNKSTRTIDRIALSDTDLAKGAVRVSVKPFQDIKIPLNYKGNFVAEAIRSERYQQTSDWQYLFAPDLQPEAARLNQAGAGIACSYIYPLIDARYGGALIFSYYLSTDKISPEHHNFMRSYSRIAADRLKN